MAAAAADGRRRAHRAGRAEPGGGAAAVSLRTERLTLRPWRPDDRVAFAALNADPAVMAHLPSVLTADESDRLANLIEAHFAPKGWGLWAVEVRDGAPFIGFVGLAPADRVLGRPCVEVGWRLSAAHWGRGYAPEAAEACLWFAFHRLELDEVVSFTVPANHQSRRVMEKVGLVFVEEFDHPALPVGDPLRRHVLYAASADTWMATPRHAPEVSP